MKKKLLRVTGAAVFIFLLIIMIVAANVFFTPYWRYSNDPDDAGESSRYRNFYEMPDNTLDYICIGPSNSYHSLEPMQVYAYSGITGFDLGGPSQPMYCSYYWIKEALKTQHPKVVFVDVGAFIRETPSKERILKTILAMKPSMLKLQAIRDCGRDDEELFYSLLFPLYQFHSRWEEFGKKDIVRKDLEPYLTKGATIRFVSRNGILADEVNLREEKHIERNEDGTFSAVMDEMPLNEDSAYWLGQMKELCDENDIELVPVKFPTKNWNERWSREVESYLDSIDLTLLDLTGEKNPTGINWRKDSFDDGKHLNYFGMTKVSRYFADYLSEQYGFISHKGDDAYGIWDRDLTEYQSWEASEIVDLMEPETEKIDYLNRVAANSGKYLILMTVNKDVSAYWPESLDGAVQKIGLETDLSDIYQQSFIAVSDGGKKYLEAADPDILNYEFDWSDESGDMHAINMKSGAAGCDSSIEVDGVERAIGDSGLNIVVIDRENGDFVSSAVIGSNDEEVEFSSVNKEYLEDAAVLPDGNYAVNTGSVIINAEISRDAEGYYHILDTDSEKYLSAGAVNTDGSEVTEETDLGLAVTKWKLYYAKDGKYWLYSVYNGMIVSGENSGLIMHDLSEDSEVPSLDIKN